jgi:hypothetical protein
MRQLAVVQVLTWLGLFCMWLFFVPATARHVFGATDPQSERYTQGMEWGGFAFAFYSITCFVVALALPKLAAATSRKTVHAAALVCGATTPDEWTWTGRLQDVGGATPPEGVPGVLVVGEVVQIREALIATKAAFHREELEEREEFWIPGVFLRDLRSLRAVRRYHRRPAAARPRRRPRRDGGDHADGRRCGGGVRGRRPESGRPGEADDRPPVDAGRSESVSAT